mmetsp:Transcript_6573/g.9788  ORF Transcript_6573/g.9788 Transcript_6573/m.9788 type:complete len:83 (+) Transcript_6573:80-328(+)
MHRRTPVLSGRISFTKEPQFQDLFDKRASFSGSLLHKSSMFRISLKQDLFCKRATVLCGGLCCKRDHRKKDIIVRSLSKFSD